MSTAEVSNFGPKQIIRGASENRRYFDWLIHLFIQFNSFDN